MRGVKGIREDRSLRKGENWGALKFINGATCYTNESLEPPIMSTKFASAAKKANNQGIGLARDHESSMISFLKH
ncbi:hypothetical protein S83_065011 [Arachis hypogaea]|uniref:Uncharacterized protein n=1 Tax=Arachis hypogaea TaxID=3818 RepID=A0A444XDJ7_ARAHY|nr:hypothetical protein Ahy_B09g095041 isoform B [Arachis hypogaea]